MNRYRPAVADRKKKTLWEWNDYQNFRFHRVFCVKLNKIFLYLLVKTSFEKKLNFDKIIENNV